MIHDCGTGVCVADHAAGCCTDSCIYDCHEAGIVATGHSEAAFINNVSAHFFCRPQFPVRSKTISVPSPR